MINLKKIKLPFKKLKYVCTSDQIVGQDGKVLSETVYNNDMFKLKEVIIVCKIWDETTETYQVKELKITKDNIASVYDANNDLILFIRHIAESVIAYVNPTNIKITIESTTDTSADIYLTLNGIYEFATSFSIELDPETNEEVLVVGEFIAHYEENKFIEKILLHCIGNIFRLAIDSISSTSIVDSISFLKSLIDGTALDV